MEKIAEFCDFEVYINSEFKGTPIIKVHYNEDDIDGEINLLTEEIQGDFDQYIFPILEAWFQEFKEELISMWNNKETYILPEWG